MKKMKGILKKNQVVIYVIALMLVTAGYLNYTTSTAEQVSAQTAMEMDSNDDMQMADIGDATLVSSNDVVTNTTDSNTTNGTTNTTENTTNLEENTNASTNSSTDNNTTTQTNATVTSDEYFTKSKLERDTMYSQMIESYQNLLDNSNVGEKQKTVATQEITKINNIQNSIMICENLIKTKGIEDVVIFVNDKSISVIVKADKLENDTIAQIQNIIAREMKAEIENIHISNK